MIDILIIEDDRDKMIAVKEVIVSINANLERSIQHAANIREAKLLLENNQFDIVIIDLVIPLRQGEVPNPQNSCDLIEELETTPFLKEPLFIIGLTKYDDLTDEFSEFFEKRLYYLLQYELNSLEWRQKLKRIIFHIVKLKKDFIDPDELRSKYDAAFICALYDPEFKAILELSDNWNKFQHHDDPTLYFETTISENGKDKRILAAYADQMGMVACSALSMKIILKFRPAYIFLTGITAGIKRQNVNFGDILIGDLCWDYNSGKISEFKVDEDLGEQRFGEILFEAEPRSISMSGKIKNILTHFANDFDMLYDIKRNWKGVQISTDLKAFIGPLGSGSQVVASSTRLAEIKLQNRKLIGIEMEAYGLYFTCTQIFESKITPVVIKSICDFGDEHKNDMYQSYAAYTSVQFAKRFLMTRL